MFIKHLRNGLLYVSRKIIGWPAAWMTEDSKHSVIRSFVDNNLGYTFVETGTYLGDTIFALRDDFMKLYSVELSKELYENAVLRFHLDDKIFVFQGDSAEILPKMLGRIDGPVLYWLDGHYSGPGTAKASNTQCPIIAELNAIIARNNCNDVILIDDARLFGWRSGYPSKRKLRSVVRENFPHHRMDIRADIICIYTDSKKMIPSPLDRSIAP